MSPLLLALALANAAPSAEPALPEPVLEIRNALRLGDNDAAVDAGDIAVEQFSGDARAWWWAGRAYGRTALSSSLMNKARWATRTRDAFEQAVALDPTHVESRLDLMGYYLAAPWMLGGGRDKAAAQAHAIAGLDTSLGKVAEAQLAASDDRPDRVQSLLEEALQLNPDNRHARLMLTTQAGARNDWQTVRAVWQAQLVRAADHATAHYQLGRAAAISGERLAEGLLHLDTFIAAGDFPDEFSVSAAYWRRGQILDRLGRREEAIESLQHAVDSRDIGDKAMADLKRIRSDG